MLEYEPAMRYSLLEAGHLALISSLQLETGCMFESTGNLFSCRASRGLRMENMKITLRDAGTLLAGFATMKHEHT